MTKKKAIAFVGIVLLLVCGGIRASAQEISPDVIRANLEFRIPQFRGSDVVMGAIAESAVDGLHEGTFTVNGNQTFRFLLSAERQELFLLAVEPIDVSLTEQDIAAGLEEERVAELAMARDRLDKLNGFSAGMPMRGATDAVITIHEFSDFQCPYCKRGFTTIEELLAKHADVRLVYLHYPLDFHEWAKPAAIASVCAANQTSDAFWTLHDAYFQDQEVITSENMLDKSLEFLQGTDIDLAVWQACAGDDSSAAHHGAKGEVEASIALGRSYGVTGTPGFFINGHYLSGAQPLETIESLMDEIRAEAMR